MIEVLFAFSIVFNIFLVWYIIQLLRRFLSFQDLLDEFAMKLKEYEEHVEIVNNLQRFYGDETLGNLLRHSKHMTQECKEFQNILLDEGEVYAEDEDEE